MVKSEEFILFPPLNSREEHLISNKVSVIMATEIEGINAILGKTEAILGIGEVAIDNFTFKVLHSSKVVTSYIQIGYFYPSS